MTTLDGTQVWRNPRLTAALESDQLSSFSQEITSAAQGFRAERNGLYTLHITVKNTGSQTWFGGNSRIPVNASYRWLDSNGRRLQIEGNRAALSCGALPPGTSHSLDLGVLAPPQPGSYSLLISMVQEGVAWFVDQGASPLLLRVTVE